MPRPRQLQEALNKKAGHRPQRVSHDLCVRCDTLLTTAVERVFGICTWCIGSDRNQKSPIKDASYA